MPQETVAAAFSDFPERALVAGSRLAIDAWTAEVVTALRREGVRCLLLKGPSLARWLYAPGEVRRYEDIDLLVSPEDVPAAERILAGFGLRLHGINAEHAHSWVSRRRPTVDLHWTLPVTEAVPAHVWQTVSRDTELMDVGGVSVEVLGEPARVFHVALHAGYHGVGFDTPLRDLDLALERLPVETWRAAAGLAERLGAREAFAAGLGLTAAGRDLAAALRVPSGISVEAALRAQTAPPVAGAIAGFTSIHGAGRKARFVARTMFPRPSYMRAWSPLAARTGSGLATSYCRRLLWLTRQLAPGVRAWRLARRTATSRRRAADW
jgi:hypothetical protein